VDCRISKRSIDLIAKVVFVAHPNSTKIAVFESVRKRILVARLTLIWESENPQNCHELL